MPNTSLDRNNTPKFFRSGAGAAMAALLPPVRRLADSLTRIRGDLANAEGEATRLKSDVGRLETERARLAAEIELMQAERTQRLWMARHAGSPGQIFSPPLLSAEQREIADRFTHLIYHVEDENSLRTYFTSWMGYEMFKWPSDLWMYQELVSRTRPDDIVETGTYRGGSALYLASICDLLDRGQVVTIDIDTAWIEFRPKHPRITYLNGSSTSPDYVAKIEAALAGRQNALVILDSDHHCEHVLAELRIYNKFVAPGGYLIVEDTTVNGHPVYPEFGPGPWEAVEAFLAENGDFEVDPTCERMYVTQNPRGFLRRKAR